MSARVIVVGSANLDLVVATPRLPSPGETVLGGDFRTVPGGKGANQAVAAARAGAGCAFVGAVGADGFGRQLRDSLVAAGVDVRGLRTADGPSGVALITVDAAAENCIVVAPGANATLTALDDADRAAVAAADVLLLQLEIPLSGVAEAAAAARDAGTTVVLNAAPAASLPAGLLALVDVLVVNEHEAAVVAGSAAGDPDALVGALLGIVPRVVLTLGASGAAYGDRDGLRVRVAAPVIDAVDTTAAGDAFTGAMAVAWAEHGLTGPVAATRDAVTAALRWACAAGAACAQHPGASVALPVRARIDSLFAATYRGTA
ncbi:PfkB family carbohydrate kinase [Dactylosporangium sp. AC04546]|uniref:PfkB family carbohydrate kinase n=1 Tax=Dactylosporangium sp. AC04546 TaxID=2862460 RepID=UPI001EE09FEB|nr:PfkB family carbohydrate kinase [Dactylosporangium sp. AC04546]WVK81983.1 PfkB family carbohydrate kinase [Dactylosporangium sp. AC04546]